MQYISTRNKDRQHSAAQAIVQGLAQDGGLLTPVYIPKLPRRALEDLKNMSYQQRAVYVMKLFLDEFSVKELTDYANAAYSLEKFDTPAVAPVHRLDRETHCLELWHGPTCAFKDMALQMLPHLLTGSLTKLEEDKTVCILVATSGDTGKGALEGFRDVSRTRILVFYPKDGVSQVQQLQMVTQEGGNVSVCAVVGNFDDAQSGVKQIFSDEELRVELAKRGYFFSSANSINWGRVLPQLVYYVSAYCDLLRDGEIESGQPINVCVPTGNFGNILAAYYAREMGVPIARLICASNQNNVLTDFCTKGTYDSKRPFFRTMSPSMDILVSSNLERLIFELSGRNAALTADRMRALAEKGKYDVTQEELNLIRDSFYAGFTSEDQTVECIYEFFTEYGYPMDTHTGVAMNVAQNYLESLKDVPNAEERPMVVVSTASPYKFPQDVLYALTGNDVKDSFKGIKRINLLTAMKVPESLKAIRYKPLRFKQVTAPAKMFDEVLKFINE